MRIISYNLYPSKEKFENNNKNQFYNNVLSRITKNYLYRNEFQKYFLLC